MGVTVGYELGGLVDLALPPRGRPGLFFLIIYKVHI